MKLRFPRPRYADVAATLALVFALGGTAYAVTSLPRNSVTTRSIQDGAVTNPKIAAKTIQGTRLKDGAVSNQKIAADAIRTGRIKDGTLVGADIADGSIGNADLGIDSVQAIQVADNTLDSGEIINNSLTGTDIADGTIGNAELASNSVNGSKVANNSIGLSDLVGADSAGHIGFTLPANSCATLNFSVGGASVGEAVIMSYTGAVALPSGVVFSPFRVVSAGNITSRACNVTGSSVSVANLGVRFVTFG